MPYIKRNEKGGVIELHNSPLETGGEWLDAGSPEIVAFLKTPETTGLAKKALDGTDNDMMRVVEDLIDLLIARKIFIYTELPEAVQVKLNARKKLRDDMHSFNDLINDNDTLF